MIDVLIRGGCVAGCLEGEIMEAAMALRVQGCLSVPSTHLDSPPLTHHNFFMKKYSNFSMFLVARLSLLSLLVFFYFFLVMKIAR